MNPGQPILVIFWFLLILGMPCITLLPNELGPAEALVGGSVMLALVVYIVVGVYQLVGRMNS